jgi:predicted small lipoprotein YifL
MMRAENGDFVVNRKYSPAASGWALILLSAVALTLGGCGRKAGLDLPPNSAAQPSSQAAPPDSAAEQASKPSLFNPSYGAADSAPVAAKGSKKPFVLDPLLN